MFLKSSVSLKQEIKCSRIIDFIRILYTVDDNNLYYNKFNDNYDSNEGGGKKDERKWWIIAPCMPTNTPLTEETKHLLKWLVTESYHPEEDYEFYEWNFDKHCIKE